MNTKKKPVNVRYMTMTAMLSAIVCADDVRI